MAWGRKTSRSSVYRTHWNKRRAQRQIPASKIPKSIARVRTDWVSVYNPTDQGAFPGGTGCSFIQAPWAPVTVDGVSQCFSSFGLLVMSADQLTDNYGDDVKIVQMVGDIWMKPFYTPADACFPDDLALLQAQWNSSWIRARGGLFKQRAINNGQLTTPHPLFGRDWTDAGFLRLWEKNWTPAPGESTATTYGEGQLIGVIGNTHQNGWTMSDGSATVPAVSTDSQIVTAGNEQCYDGPSLTRYREPGWKRQSLASRRTIRLHEDDALTWNIDWTLFGPSAEGNVCNLAATTSFPCAMAFLPSLKIKLQYG